MSFNIKLPSSSKCMAIVMTIMILTSSFACGSQYTPRATAASPVQKLTTRSLLDILMGIGSSDSEKSSLSASASSSSSAPEKQSSSLIDLATTLIGKGDGSNALYLKLLKLLLNLFMDVMLDRMGSDRREDTGKMNPLTPLLFLRNERPPVNSLQSSSPSLKRLQEGSFRPYFVN